MLEQAHECEPVVMAGQYARKKSSQYHTNDRISTPHGMHHDIQFADKLPAKHFYLMSTETSYLTRKHILPF